MIIVTHCREVSVRVMNDIAIPATGDNERALVLLNEWVVRFAQVIR